MIGASDQSEDDSCHVIVDVAGRRVMIIKELKDQYERFPIKEQARFYRIMEMWCFGHNMPKKMLNKSEGRSPKGNILIQAFKAFKIRLYGFVSGSDFIIVEIDPAKKQDKADPRMLDRAKTRADSM